MLFAPLPSLHGLAAGPILFSDRLGEIAASGPRPPEALVCALNFVAMGAGDMVWPSGSTIPAATRAFAAFQLGDYAATIDLIVPMVPDRERMGGSRAQVELVEATLLRA